VEKLQEFTKITITPMSVYVRHKLSPTHLQVVWTDYIQFSVAV